jgi:hypothetical protein
MFKVFKFIFKTQQYNMLSYLNLTINHEDFICFVNLMQSRIFDYFVYKIFKKYFNIYNYFLNNYSVTNLYYTIRYSSNLNDILCIGMFNKSKFYWTNFSYSPIKFFNTIKNNFKPIFFINQNCVVDKTSQIYTYINLKKQVGLVKRKDRSTYNTLINVNFLKNYKYYTNPQFNSRNLDFSKLFDLKRKSLKTFILNRMILKKMFFITNSRQSKLTKFFSKNLTKSISNCINSFEYSLSSLLVKSKFVFTLQDAIFLIRNNLVYVNKNICNDVFARIQTYDNINLVFTKKYFYFFKTMLNNQLKLTSFLSYRLWRYNRFRSNFYKQSPISLPTWINKVSYFYYDVPNYLEVDYITLSLMIVKPISKSLYSSKSANVFLFRLYNWKYIN